MTCDEHQAQYLAAGASRPFDAHARSCAACRSARPDLDELREQLSDPLIWEQPPADLVHRVTVAIDAERDRSGAGRSARLWIGIAAALVVIAGLASWLTRAAAAPDWTVELASTAASPAAIAVVDGWNTDSGTRMRIHTEGLEPVSDEVEYYEVWMTSADGRHISAGTFKDSGTIEVWSAVSRRDFPRIWITKEPLADGSRAVTVLDTPGF